MIYMSRILLLLVLSLGSALTSRAQSVQDIINKYLQAMGGKEKLQTINSVYQEGIAVLENGAELSSRSWRVYDRVYRQEISMPAGKVTIVVTPSRGWSAGPGTGGLFKPLSDAQFKSLRPEIDPGGALVDYAAKGYALSLLGKEAVNGKTCYKIKIAKAGDPDFIYFIDATTYLISKVQTDIKANGSVITTDAVMEDYRKTPEGYTFPFSTTVTVQTGEIKSVVNKITVNPTVAPALFQKP